jgi:hypothetical protein
MPSPFATEFHNLGAQLGQALLLGEGACSDASGRSTKSGRVCDVHVLHASDVARTLAVIRVVVPMGRASRRRVARQLRWDGSVRNLIPEMPPNHGSRC